MMTPRRARDALVRSADVRLADAAAPGLGVPERDLMTMAGRAVADVLRDDWPQVHKPLVLCGTGNNGGDGYVAARTLRDAGLEPRVLALDPTSSRSATAEEARRDWHAVGDTEPLDEHHLDSALASADLIVDALLGTGLSRPLSGELANVVARLAATTLPILCVDVPTGVDADAAIPPGVHVHATATVQLAWSCLASALPPARFAFGRLHLADIGMPNGALPARDRAYRVLDEDVTAAWPAPPRDAHKYQLGSVTIIGGCQRWSGAAELACRGAHRAGAGLVTLLTDAPHPGRWPETMVLPLDATRGALQLGLSHLETQVQHARVAGPGLDPTRLPEVAASLTNASIPTILDATALDPALRVAVTNHAAVWLTPHVGEAARLLDRPAQDVRHDPIGAAQELARTWNAGVILKLAGAVIATPSGALRVVAAGHPAMASGGSGDVLAGVLGAALASLAATDHAAAVSLDAALPRMAAAVHLHARAGEHVARMLGQGAVASNLADAIATTRVTFEGAW